MVIDVTEAYYYSLLQLLDSTADPLQIKGHSLERVWLQVLPGQADQAPQAPQDAPETEILKLLPFLKFLQYQKSLCL